MDYDTDAPSLNRKWGGKGFSTRGVLKTFVAVAWMAAMPLAAVKFLGLAAGILGVTLEDFLLDESL